MGAIAFRGESLRAHGALLQALGDQVQQPFGQFGLRRRPQRACAAVPVHDQRVVVALETAALDRSEEHTSELQSLMRISYAVFCLKKKKNNNTRIHQSYNHK